MRKTTPKSYDQLLKDQIIKQGLSSKTFDTYIYAMKRIIKHTGKLPDKITKDDVHEFQVSYQNKYNKSYSTYRITCYAIRFFFKMSFQGSGRLNVSHIQKHRNECQRYSVDLKWFVCFSMLQIKK